MHLFPYQRRLFLMIPVILLFLIFLILDGFSFFSKERSMLAFSRYGASALTGCFYLVIGGLVWLFARRRLVAWLLFGFCSSTAIVFAAETAAASNDLPFVALSAAVSAIAFAMLAVLLLSLPGKVWLIGRFVEKPLGYGIITTSLAILGALPAGYAIPFWLYRATWGAWSVPLKPLDFGCYAVLLGCCLLFTYARTGSVRERQQMRFVSLGVIMALAPLLLLTVLPAIFGWQALDGQITTIFFVLVPLALAYSILRHQLLVVDATIRSVTLIICRAVCFAVLVCLIPMIWLSLPVVWPIQLAGGLISACVMGLVLWPVSRSLVDRVLFPEMDAYDRFLADRLADQTPTVEDMARFLTIEAKETFATEEVCFFVYDEQMGGFSPAPELSLPGRVLLVEIMEHLVPDIPLPDGEDIFFASSHPFVQRLMLPGASPRPWRIPRAKSGRMRQDGSLARVLVLDDPPSAMLMPLWHADRLIGVLIVGNAHENLTGPDYEVVRLLVQRFVPSLATALVERQGQRQVALLTGLYAVGIEPAEGIDDLAQVYVTVAADATAARAEAYLKREDDDGFRLAAWAGRGPTMISQPVWLDVADWKPWFHESADSVSRGAPSCLQESLPCALAWLPLVRHEQAPFGVLVLTYPRPHRFIAEERQLLLMFADQLAAALERSRLLSQLQASLARSQQLERLQQEFLAAVSGALLPPLTVVGGCMQELSGSFLSQDEQAACLEQAELGCEELTLLSNLILSSSQCALTDIRLQPILLWQVIEDVRQKLRESLPKEKEIVVATSPDPVYVLADPLILHQVILYAFCQLWLNEPPSPIQIEVHPLQRTQVVIVRIHCLSGRSGTQREEAESGVFLHERLLSSIGGRLLLEDMLFDQNLFAFSLPMWQDALHPLPNPLPASL